VLVSDTVGFIKNLRTASSHRSVDARRSARGVAARPRGRCERCRVRAQIAVTEEVLDEIGAGRAAPPRLQQIDKGGEEAALRAKHPAAS